MAQLGARFHGMEEVVSSNLTRSTKTFQTLTARLSHFKCPRGSPKGFRAQQSFGLQQMLKMPNCCPKPTLGEMLTTACNFNSAGIMEFVLCSPEKEMMV